MTTPFQLIVDRDGIAKVYFDTPGEKINKLGNKTLQYLKEFLDSLMERKDIKVLLFISKKKDFIVGADLNEVISGFKDSAIYQYKLAEGRETIFKIRSLPFPTIALIHGACPGGGLEFVLQCTYRIVTDHPKTTLFLPETAIGILPGWGGTQMAPRLIGLQKAAEMILGGKRLNGVQAFKCHLADGIAPVEFLEERGLEFARMILTSQGKKKVLGRRKNKGIKTFLLEKTPLGRKFLFSRFKKEILKKTKGFYPAPLITLEVIEKTCTLPLDKGLQVERDGLINILNLDKDIPFHLVSLFMGQEKLKKAGGYVGDLPEVKDVENGAVLGAGAMGAGIAYLFANAKIPVRIKDINWEMIGRGVGLAWSLFQKNILRKKLKTGEGEIKFHEISYTTTYSGFEKTDFVLEVIIEEIEPKHKVYKEVENVVSKDAIIASNTSSLRVEDLAAKMEHPERFIGMHFFIPAPTMPLVEIVKGPKTSMEAFAKTLKLATKIGKVPLVVKDCHGFLVNRILIAGAIETLNLLAEGATIEELDANGLAFGLPMGTCEVMDFSGLDIFYHVAHTFNKAYGERMAVPIVLTKLYEAKLFGKKTGKGFYLYKGKSKTINPDAVKLIHSIQTGKKASPSEISERSLLVMINEASRCLEEQIVTDPAYIDLALVLGSGFPPFRGGILAYADKMGLKTVYEKLKNLESVSSARFKPTKMIEELAKTNNSFYKR